MSFAAEDFCFYCFSDFRVFEKILNRFFFRYFFLIPFEEHIFFFQEPPTYQDEAVAQFLRQDGVANQLLALRDRLRALSAFDTAAVEEATRAFIAERQLPSKALIHPVRVAVTGRSVSPPLFETMSILGKDHVLSRLEYAATKLAQ